MQSRKWQITINNPDEKGMSHDVLKEIMSKFKSCVYYCMCDEIGQQETYHTHLYFVCKGGVEFETVRKRFRQIAHIEYCNGTSQQNRDYVRKEGKYLKDKKHETNLIDTFYEWGEMPIERQGARNDLVELLDMVKAGKTNVEIIEENANYCFSIDKIDRVRMSYNEENYKNVFRTLDVTYVFGKAGTGKTRGVMDSYGYSNVYRITDYNHPFDMYGGQDVILFDEFRSSLKITDMLNYLDGYPLMLPARFSNRVACYTKVYLCSNIELEKQFTSIQKEEKETWRALLRRINRVVEYTDNERIEYATVDEYFSREELWKNVNEQITIPF